MTEQSLLSFFGDPEKQEKEKATPSPPPEKESPPPTEEKPQTEPQQKPEAVVYPDFPEDLPPSYLVSVTYDGKKQLATLKLYEPESQRIYFWDDNTGHKPYCLTSLPPHELEKLRRVTGHSGFDHFETVEKIDPLLDKQVKVTKVVAKDPLAIGGRSSGCLRDVIPEDYQKLTGIEEPPKVWESYIRYYQSYIYDNDLALGMLYKIQKGKLVPVQPKASEDTVEKILSLFSGVSEEFLQSVEKWARLLESPAPEFLRAALDIEVSSPVATRIPDPNEAAQPVVCVALYGSDQKKQLFVLRREGIREGNKKLPADAIVKYYKDEKELLKELFEALREYPFILTFNGDEFDLPYLYNRARNHFGFDRSQIPIDAGRRVFHVSHGVHIDLYKFFFNRSIQIYAFGNKYRDITLDAIGTALLGLPKIEFSKPLSELSYTELAEYNLRDSEITLNLTAFNDNLVMKLILAMSRIARMPMEDVSRQGVSRWIRNFLYHEHRQRNMLIPNAEDILALKGGTSTTAIIKGKKYKGAIVVDPVPGVHFNVAVMDFASLYPSIIKVYNLGYQTLLCKHEECKTNKVPETSHWICTKNKALESLLIGSLRDLRVKWYKPKSKDKTLPQDLRSWYNVIPSALKVILNASYGVFGSPAFGLYCPPVAEATAAIGRHVITQTIEKAKALNIEVLYGDTDSLFLKNPSPEQIKILEEWSKKTMGMELEVEKYYRYAVFSSRKKNYLGILKDGGVDVKGMTGKKRHIPPYIKKAFYALEDRLEQVQSPTEFEEAKKEIKKIIRDRYLRLKQRRWGENPEELAFHVVLGKPLESYTKTTPQHVKAARKLKEMGYEMKTGDLISFVKVVNEPHVKPVQIASNSEIDVDKYVGYLHSTFDQILDALGLDFDEIIGLTKLERFM
ncbi:MAG TPA: DNA-directed DNA polymerase I [Candidatus Bathyarchaeota archaeon]|mgnify:CR=1 FL=1|nr:DNA-directed DNA polymerase I [Candidatus Bathyarchaeota archaeon]